MAKCRRCDLPGKKLCDVCKGIEERVANPKPRPRPMGERARVGEKEKKRRLSKVVVKKMPPRERRKVKGNGTRAFYYAQDRWCVVYRKGRGQPLRVYRAGLAYNVARRAESAAKRAGLKYVKKCEGIPAECQGVK